MGVSDDLLDAGRDIWAAQKTHPFVVELADGTLDQAAFEHWVRQDYRYLLDYARIFAIAGVKAQEEALMTAFLTVAHTTLDHEMDLHRQFAREYGITTEELEATEKAPTCQAYTDFLVRTAYEHPLPVIAAALFPCMQGYLDVATHMNDRADGTHAYTPFIDMYTGDEFRDACAWTRDIVDRLGDTHPGYHDHMHQAFRTSARLEHQFWEMAYTQETWPA